MVMTSPYRCTCGLIDVHAHCLPPAYRQALSDAGFTSLDGGYPIPSWSAEKALEVMNANGIDMMMLSVSSPSVGFLPDQAVRVKLAHRINEDVAQTIKAHPGRFGGFATALRG
jgi:6-methylsalicylate decarboxylase